MNVLDARRWMLALVVYGSLAFTGVAFATAPSQPNTANDTQYAPHTSHSHAYHGAVYNVSQAVAQQNPPSVTVDDQPIVDNTITVAEVSIPQDGWAVVHTVDAQGKPIANQVVGSMQVREGTNTNVEIELTESFAPGDELQVMLHIDEGTKGTLEFPSGPDAPVAVDGEIVASNFTVLEEGAESGGHQAGGDHPEASSSPSPQAAQMPNTGTSSTLVPLLLIVAGLMLIAAGVLRHVSARSTVQ